MSNAQRQRAALPARCIKVLKHGNARFFAGHQFAIDYAYLGDHGLQDVKTASDIGAAATEDGGLTVRDVDLGAPAVKLHHPIVADGRGFRQRRHHGVDEGILTQHAD